MNKPCGPMQEGIADLVLGLLDLHQKTALLEHMDSCPGCREYLRALEQDKQLLVHMGRDQEDRMDGRIQATIRAFNALPGEQARPSTRRKIMTGTIVKLAAAAAVVVAASLTALLGPKSATGPSVVPPMLASAMAAEDALFTGVNTIHIKNEITVYPSATFKALGFTWIPMCSLKADGTFRFDQLKLAIEDQPYTVTDQAWYDPPTGRFVRVLQTEKTVVFANSFDGQFVYASEVSAEGRLQVAKTLIEAGFKAPQRPADFFGLSAGMKSGLDKKDSMVLGTEAGKLDDGTAAHVYKVGQPDPNGLVQAFWLFKVRDDDNTIAEDQFVVDGRVHIRIRRIFARPADKPDIGWDLAGLSGLDASKAQATIMQDMVVPNVSVKHMIEKADFETYVFKITPAWTKDPTIVDCIDPPSLGKRMFIFTCRADDHRHLVLVQSPSYNMMLGQVTKQGTLVYTSPNGFKVWGGGPSRWMAGILLQSAQAWIKEAPAEDRIGFILESPAGTFPALAVNGPLSDEEIHSLIDSLMPAKEYLKSN